MSAVTIDQVREKARSWVRGNVRMYASPYRMGMAAAELGAEISVNPYPPGSRGHHTFLKGFFAVRDSAAEVTP